jgi:murein DD-endopeptidase MepM/ murein hydrolase activator NlpD
VFRLVSPEEQAGREDLPDEVELLALRYSCPAVRREWNIFRFQTAGTSFAGYFYADGTNIEPVLAHAPIREYIQITSLFGERRGRTRHQGVDFKAPVGTPVYAPFSGQVRRVNWHRRSNGNCLEIALDRQPYIATFLHLDKVLVHTGQSVRAGQQVGTCGNTGRSSAPHLHYQINRGVKGPAVDPLKFHDIQAISLAPADTAAFRQAVMQYHTLWVRKPANK